LPERNENAVKNHFFSILKITSKEKISEEEITRKIYLKIKSIQDNLSIDHPLPPSVRPINLKTMHDVSLSNLSLSNPSFSMIQHNHKRMKIKVSPIMERHQITSSKHLDYNNTFNSKAILIDPVFSSIVLGPSDFVRDSDLMNDEGQTNLCQMFENSLGFRDISMTFLIFLLRRSTQPKSQRYMYIKRESI